uniref:Uncharacterized protein n=1 Tax=Arion vulgaris TaxID=1028688 RepID=A0A0B6ZDD1_9EUPU
MSLLIVKTHIPRAAMMIPRISTSTFTITTATFKTFLAITVVVSCDVACIRDVAVNLRCIEKSNTVMRNLRREILVSTSRTILN